MAVEQWIVINPGITTGHPRAVPGLVVNGGTRPDDPMPTSGRGYPRE
jgi:hypothetical protein